MDPSTPGKGISTSGVASCTVVVLHCPATKRTTVSHSPNRLFLNTFVPMIDWIIGGSADQVSPTQRNMWRMGFRVTTAPAQIDVAVIRGSWYGDAAEARRYGHESWMSDFRDLFNEIEKSRGIKAEILDSPRILSSGTVLVDKETGNITYVSVVGASSRLSMKPMEFVSDTPSYTLEQRHQDLFAGNLVVLQDSCPEIHMQWDLDHYCPHPPLADIARLLLRSKFLGETAEKQQAILRSASIPDFISTVGGNLSLDQATKSVWDLYGIGMKAPCEMCGMEGTLKCSSCRGAWYCGKFHQTEHWKLHKGWCKSHKWPTGA